MTRISTDCSGRVTWVFCRDHDHEPRPEFTLLSVNIRSIREIRVLFPIISSICGVNREELFDPARENIETIACETD